MPLPSGRNPWLTIWTSPRATMREILDTDPKRMVPPLALVGGFISALDRAAFKNLGDHLSLPAIFLTCAIGGSLGGILGLYVGGALLRWTGRWIGGQGTSEQVRSAMAWSTVPVLWTAILFIPELALLGKELFTTATPRMNSNRSLAFTMMGFGAVEIVLGIWALVIFLKCLGEAQGFSAWKAAVNSALAGLVVLVPLLILVFGAIGIAKVMM